jgi:hypothetical protein
MQSGTTGWGGLSALLRGRRPRTARHRRPPRLQKIVAVLAKVTMGLMLVGCASVPGLRAGGTRDPLAAIQGGATGNERIGAYRELGNVEKLSPEARTTARRMLLEAATEEYNVLARAAAVGSLAQYEDAEVVEVLLRATGDRNPIVRVEACRALKGRSEPSAREKLKQLAAKDPEPDVRLAATSCIAAAGGDDAIDALMERLKDEDLAVARRAADGLRNLTGAPIVGENHAQWSEWLAQNPQARSVQHTAAKEDRGGLFDLFRR